MSAITQPAAGLVGRSQQRVEDAALLRGEGWFMDDLSPLPGIAHAAVVRSTLAHARIVGVDTAAAEAMEGVIGVLTGRDVESLSRPFLSVLGVDLGCWAAAVHTVRYVGEPVAVVVAVDRYRAEDAAEAVVVDYDPLPVAADLDAALDDAAPLLHPDLGSNVVSDRRMAYGDPARAFAEAEVVVGGRFRLPRSTATPVECYGVVCNWEAATSSVTAWSNFQGPFTVHGVAAAALGIPAARLRLVTPPDSGGSFGTKAAVYVYVVLMALASRRFGVPIRWTEDRVEHLLASSSATERRTDAEAAFSADGRLLGLRLDLVDDVGAFVRAPEPATLYRMHSCLTGAYACQDLEVRARVVVTNRCPTGLNRGFGGPQLYLALERLMAMAARRLDLDPAEVARRNLVPADAMPYRTATGATYDSGDYRACLEEALDLAGYPELRDRQRRARAEGRLYGIGLACVVEPSVSNMGYISLTATPEERAAGLPKSGNAEGVTVAMGPHGGVTVRFTTTPQGQGHRTVAAQVVADALGVDVATVDVRTDADTAANPWTVSSGNYSSRFAAVGAGAVHVAATRLAASLRAIAAAHLGCDAEEVTLEAGTARVASDRERSVSLRRLAGTAHWDPAGLPPGVDPGLAVTSYLALPGLEAADGDDRINASATYGFLADVVAVEIDRDRGDVRIERYVTVHDAGRVLNPALAEGQVHGGLAQGLGAALMERHVYDGEGQLVTASFLDYVVPTATELPPVTTRYRETPSPVTPLGAKGLGEGNTMSAPAAVANAVADATGVDAVDPPFTSARVWALLQP
jgi:2-furoyl-CoA dehydrogenase large subunit